MRLTVNHLRRAPQFTNVLLQREIDLRGLGLSSLDESALLLLANEFDVVNLTSNALTSLEYFPVTDAAKGTACMDRVTSLVAHRNHIQKVSVASCTAALPNLAHFLADRNRFRTVRDLLFLKQWKHLEVVSLEDNPVWDKNPEAFDEEKLRAFLVFLCPKLKLINYTRVLLRDRERADALRKEFKALVAQWEGSTLPAVSADGRKVRKRGRENRAAAERNTATVEDGAEQAVSPLQREPSAEQAPAANDASALPTGAVDETPAPAKETPEDALQARLDELGERIMSDDITPEEIVALEQEMNELMAEQDRRKKRRK